MACCTRTFAEYSMKSVRSRGRQSRRRSGTHSMPSARLRLFALAGCTLLGACNDTSNFAPASPDTPWQAQSADEAAPLPPAPVATPTSTTTPTSATTMPREFTVPQDGVAQSPSPSGIDPNHVYSLVELIDIA